MTQSGVVILWVWLVTCLIFAIFPGVDLAVSAWFFDAEAGGFALNHYDALQRLRYLIWNASYVLAFAILAFGVHALLSSSATKVPGRLWGFCLALILVGPAWLVNSILKTHWGRARPEDISEFGGALTFTPPFQIAAECARNCSFVSGEAASAATAAILIGVIFWHSVPDKRRAAFVIALAAFVIVAAGMRVIKGRHFLSDVLWSVILSGTLAYLLARLFQLKTVHQRITAAALKADAQTLGRDLIGLPSAIARRLRRIIKFIRLRFVRPGGDKDAV